MRLLGLSCDYHDAAAAVVVDGEVVAAAEQERFSRRKHDASLPVDAVASCLAVAGLAAHEIDAVVLHEKPLLVTSRAVAARQRRGPAAMARFAREMPTLLRDNLMIGARIESMFRDLDAPAPTVRYSEHHLSHAAAAFLPSPFDTAAILTVDGVGEWATSTIGHGLHHRIDLLAEQRFPHSVGLLYSLVTSWCGFRPNDGEYKLMGLAPYGSARYADALSRLATVGPDGALAVDARLLRWWSGDLARSRRLADLFGGPPRRPEDPITERECDLARSVQELTETVVLKMAAHARELTGERSVCLGGGVALNCVAMGRLLREGPFDDVWVQPAAGDAGSAIGAALWYWYDQVPSERRAARRGTPVTSLGPAFATDEVRDWLAGTGVGHRHVPDLGDRVALVAERLAEGAVVGWFEGRMEFGPRALGHRSILADPRSPTAAADLNIRVKGRESFRPFAPAVRWERCGEWFDLDVPSPHMSFTVDVAARHLIETGPEPVELFDRARVPRSTIPACTHVDGSARVQTVHEEHDPVFAALLDAFEARTACPVLLNTSFNVADEPIVCTPADALDTARRAGLDLLVVDEYVIDPIGTS